MARLKRRMPELVDFDWSLRLVLSSSNLSAMRKPVLVVDLSLRYADGSERPQMIELNEQDLDLVLQNFDNIEKVISRLEIR